MELEDGSLWRKHGSWRLESMRYDTAFYDKGEGPCYMGKFRALPKSMIRNVGRCFADIPRKEYKL